MIGLSHYKLKPLGQNIMTYLVNLFKGIFGTIGQKLGQSQGEHKTNLDLLVLYTLFVSYCLTLIVLIPLLNH